MAGGRPRLPTAVHNLKGTEQKHPDRMRERSNEPQPSEGIGPCPENLQELQPAWDYIVSCCAAGVLTGMDRIVLSQAAALLTLFWQNPLEFDAKLHARLHALIGTMGMTPADRSKVVVPKAPTPANPFAKFKTV